jgi:hypothetical protein
MATAQLQKELAELREQFEQVKTERKVLEDRLEVSKTELQTSETKCRVMECQLKEATDLLQNQPATTFVGTVGAIQEFVPGGSETWEIYCERLEFYFSSNNITSLPQKKSILFSSFGKDNYILLKKLCVHPHSPQTISYKDAVELLTKHFDPKPNVYASMSRFHARVQNPGEPLSHFLADINGMAKMCNFDNIEQALLAQTLTGIRDMDLKEEILQIPELSYEKCVRKAKAAEAAHAVARQLHGTQGGEATAADGGAAGVYKVGRRGGRPWQRRGGSRRPEGGNHHSTGVTQGSIQSGGKHTASSCFRCDGTHAPEHCRYKNTSCSYCSKLGHIERACLSKKASLKRQNSNQTSRGQLTSRSRGQGTRTSSRPHTAHFLEETDGEDDEDHGLTGMASYLHHTTEKGSKSPYKIIVRINGQQLSMEVDSGAICTIIGYATYLKLFPGESVQLLPCPKTLQTWSREPLAVAGYLKVKVSCANVEHTLPLVVMQNSGPSLMGRNWFQSLGIELKVPNINTLHPLKSVQASKFKVPVQLADFQQVFAPGLGTCTITPVHLDMKEGVAPVFRPPRPVPYAKRTRVHEALQQMVDEGAIAPVTSSAWATPTVNVEKTDGSIRVFGDYSGTINPRCNRDIYPMPSVNEILMTLSGGVVFTKLDLALAYLQMPVDEVTSKVLTINTFMQLPACGYNGGKCFFFIFFFLP